jgi:tryptophan halogenase
MSEKNHLAPDPIKNIVIVGGGTSGWMSAAALSRLIAHAGVSITLIESDEIGTVGVGEATIPSLRLFNQLLNIDENAFMKATQATIKLGIEFCDWHRKDDRYLHPFGSYGFDAEAIKFHQMWMRLSSNPETRAEVGGLSEYNLCAQAAMNKKFSRPNNSENVMLSTLKYAFHFDSGLYAGFLRNYCEKAGVIRIEGKIAKVNLRPTDGFIESVTLENQAIHHADFFIDCSGFRSLLLGKNLNIGYESWKEFLPCNSAVTVPSTSNSAPLPYTRAIADVAGWRWNIPLQHRIGNGYVYCDKYLSDEMARLHLLLHLDGELLAEPRLLKFETGKREKFWEKNCVAIGLAAGFIEPLESTSIHLVQSGIAKLLGLFPNKRFDPAAIEEYNKSLALEYECIRDFIILHYKATQRDDSAFWRRCRDMKIPDSLQHKIDLFRSQGRITHRAQDLFTDDSWLAVFIGQHVFPQSYDPLADSLPLEKTKNYLHYIRTSIEKTLESLPSHQEFIVRNCNALDLQS